MITSFLLLVFIFLFSSFLYSKLLESKRNEPAIKNGSKNNRRIKNEEVTLLGIKGRNKKIYIKNNSKHIFICGTTGSGKTVSISNFIDSIFKYNYPSLIVDGKGDTNKDSIIDIVNQMNKKHGSKRKLYIIDMNNPNTSDKYNPFRGCTPTIVKDMLISMTDWSEEHYKVNVSRYLQKLVTMMKEMDIKLSFDTIVKNLSFNNYKKLSLNLEKNESITKQEHLENLQIYIDNEKAITGAIARFTLLLESDIGSIFSDNGISVPIALNEKAIIVFLLNSLTYPEISPLFGRLITIDSKQGVSSLFHKRFKRTFFIFDEISEYVSDNLLLLVNQSRSANITSILASQSLSDIDKVSESLRKQVIENCNNYIIMRQNEPSNAENWANTIGTKKVIKPTRQYDKDGINGTGSLRDTREFIYHPDEIKNLPQGVALFISKDENTKDKIKVNKPF